MTSRLKKRWVAVGLIWGVVLAMSGWNIHLIGRVQHRRQDMETVQMDLRFLNDHRAAIQEVRTQQTGLIHAVKSVDLGFVVVESNLKRLSWDCGLQQLRVEADRNVHDGGTLPISIFASGPVPGVVAWITAVEEAYPYLVIQRMDIVYDPAVRSSRLQATFSYHFTLSETQRVG